jgi:uncharacterized lipoprotein YmbA
MMRQVRAVMVFACLAILGVGCSSTPQARFYTLSPTSTPAAASSETSVAVGPVAVPATVDRPQIVVSLGPNSVWLDEFNRWAAPLQDDIARVVAENLVAMLGTPRVARASQTVSAGFSYRAVIAVESFESVPGEMARLDAVWTVSRSKDGTTQTGRTTVREPTTEKGYEALAAAHSRAVARLSRDIADAVGALERREK